MPKSRSFWSQFFSGPERAFLFESLASNLGRSIYVPLIFSFVIFSTGFLFPPATYFGISIHVLDAMALPVSVTVFALGNLLKPTKSGAALNISIWLAAGMLSAVSPTLILIAATGQASSELLVQLPVGLVAYSVLIALTAIIFSGLRISRQRFGELKRHKALLDEIRNDLELQILTMRDEIKRGVDKELEKALDVLDQGKDPKLLAERLFDAIDEVIRPLSHRLAGLALKSAPPRLNQQTAEVPREPKGVSLSRLVAPEIYFLLFAIFILPATLFLQGTLGFFTALGFLLVEVAILVILQITAKAIYLNRLIAMLALATLSGFISLGYLFVGGKNSDSGIAIGFITVSLAVTGVMALVSKRLDDLAQLSRVNQQMQAVVSILRQEAWVTKNQLAKAIHGSVQAKFLAVALRLSNLPKLTKSDLAAARKEIETSFAEVAVSLEGKSAPFAAQLKTITDAWEGVVRIRVKADKSTIALVNRFPLARTCVLEVIGEAVSNAAKHSKSPSMDIELQENDLGQVVISVWSAGRLGADSGRKGYGSQMLDEVTSSWSLTNLKGRVYLRAIVPLAK